MTAIPVVKDDVHHVMPYYLKKDDVTPWFNLKNRRRRGWDLNPRAPTSVDVEETP